MLVDAEPGPPRDLADHRAQAGILDLRRAAAARAHDVVVVGRGAAHVGVLAARQVDPLDGAELGQDVERPEDRRAADPEVPDPRLVDEVGRREVARLGADQAA